jgi:hypothetical protein
MSAAATRREAVLSSWRQLLRLIGRLPEEKRVAALAEARTTARQRKTESNPETLLAYQKELAAKIGYLRIVTPRQPGDVDKGIGRWVMRDGMLVEGQGEEKGERWVKQEHGHVDNQQKHVSHLVSCLVSYSSCTRRVGSTVVSWDEAMKLNNKHFKRFYGADKPPVGKVFF